MNGEYRLCFRYKEQLCVSELFYSWWKLQSLVYTHKTTRAVEMMIAEAMDKADAYFEISKAREEPGKFMMLSDSIFHQILRVQAEGDDSLKAAKEILERIKRRCLYQFCGQTSSLPVEGNANLIQAGYQCFIDHAGALSPGAEERQRQAEIRKTVTDGIIKFPTASKEITADDLFVEVIQLRYGNGRTDPLDSIDFVNKEGTLVKRSPAVEGKARPGFLGSFQEEYIRVYARSKEKINEINNRFYGWCLQNGYDVPKDMEKTPIENDEMEDAQDACRKSRAIRRLDFTADESEASI